MTRVITAIGDSIVDTVGRCSVGDTTQWLYKLMQALGEANIHMEPLPEFGVTPNILVNRWATFPTLCDGLIDSYETISNNSYIINMTPYYPAGTQFFAVRIFTQASGFTLRAFTSLDGTTWSGVPNGIIMKEEGHSPQWSFCNWTPAVAKYLKLEIIGNMEVSEVQLVANVGSDRGSCLNKIVGEEYIFQNVGLGSQTTNACYLRFSRDVVDIGSDTVIILAGINDIYQNVELATTQANLLAMFDLADAAGIRVVPVTLLPYTPSSLTEARYLEIKSKIEALNAWIRSTALIRRYGVCDWYEAMQDPNNPGHMYSQYTCDGIHLSIEGNAKIVEAFDLDQLSVETHDFYVMPLYMIPFSGVRTLGDITFTFGNGIETNYRIYKSYTPNITQVSTLLTAVNATGGTYTHAEEVDAYYRCYGVDTGVWTDEIFIAGRDLGPQPPALGESPKKVVASIPRSGITVRVQIEERDLETV